MGRGNHFGSPFEVAARAWSRKVQRQKHEVAVSSGSVVGEQRLWGCWRFFWLSSR